MAKGREHDGESTSFALGITAEDLSGWDKLSADVAMGILYFVDQAAPGTKESRLRLLKEVSTDIVKIVSLHQSSIFLEAIARDMAERVKKS